ncbi:hypothetical protein HWN49_27045 [Pseudomonas aeruginosa]|uniref:hypothetical protein n=1 Tax=Pseudomonas aeruginosa TaxID=287 RepID=UPI00159CDE48|nr:hypothetical protein [Pseudomonas aeruginosa]QKZ78920.1 hypothetical protein HWN49_27045 [Pseudomonas aeruginosa]HBP1919031.1 hypothetical protein [Pseudomonas aeruginosa]HBP1975688.1 hypothetical protein [Pseudomonas aeruginosa]HBP1987754.1 hypothetical protein [Pseudomonas aeruginosa]HBP1998764.1 hypothetical protein [Pseudomonas aeruginosa]
MKTNKITIALLALFAFTSANAQYVVKVAMDKNAIDFKQYYDNVGANPGDNKNNSSDPACTVSQADLDVFGGELIRVFDDESMSCVVDYAVPAATFSPDCVGLEQATAQGLEFTHAMIAKGVKGFSSFAYFGECS